MEGVEWMREQMGRENGVGSDVERADWHWTTNWYALPWGGPPLMLPALLSCLCRSFCRVEASWAFPIPSGKLVDFNLVQVVILVGCNLWVWLLKLLGGKNPTAKSLILYTSLPNLLVFHMPCCPHPSFHLHITCIPVMLSSSLSLIASSSSFMGPFLVFWCLYTLILI